MTDRPWVPIGTMFALVLTLSASSCSTRFMEFSSVMPARPITIEGVLGDDGEVEFNVQEARMSGPPAHCWIGASRDWYLVPVNETLDEPLGCFVRQHGSFLRVRIEGPPSSSFKLIVLMQYRVDRALAEGYDV